MNLTFPLNRKSIAKKLTIVGKDLVLVMNPTKAAFRQCRVSRSHDKAHLRNAAEVVHSESCMQAGRA